MFRPSRNRGIVITAVAIIIGFTSIVTARKGIPINKIATDSIDARLALARDMWHQGLTKDAIREIENQVELDSTLIPQAAIILGGNYHLVRLTNNVFADRVGGFSPSGDKLVYSRDTSLTRLDDGLFDWYENRTTGIVYYDFELSREIIPDLPVGNAFKPRFSSDTCFYYLGGSKADLGFSGAVMLNRYYLKWGTSIQCIRLRSRHYCSYGDGVVCYQFGENTFTKINLIESKQDILFDNDDVFTLRRSLPLVQNLSAGDDIIMFQAGHTDGRVTTNIYGIPVEGGKPRKMLDQKTTWLSKTMFYPAAVNSTEFAYLVKESGKFDIYYAKDGIEFRLTYDGGDKYYLAISPDGSRIAYSFMPTYQGVETYEIFILDFGQDADVRDLKYRINILR
ncbi:MAG: hypothetical protein GY839_00985 [candidate division Zixibacteria bacterium]|nr:hypothetical protein [candidate division Zixibacteria bacterium]